MLPTSFGSARWSDVRHGSGSGSKSRWDALRTKAVVRSHDTAWQMLPEIPLTHGTLGFQFLVARSEAFC